MAKLCKFPDQSCVTALHVAVQYHRIDNASRLIKRGVDVNVKNPQGQTPLQMAVISKSYDDLVRTMIPNGVAWNKSDFYALDSLRIATGNNNDDWIRNRDRYLASQGLKIDGVNHDLVNMLLNAGANVNVKDRNDCSPIQSAIYTADLELVETLINAGADVNSQNEIGATALHDAVLSCNAAMVHLLLRRGASVSLKTYEEGETALHWASQFNKNHSHDVIIRTLLAFGSDVNEGNALDAPCDGSAFSYILMSGDINLVNFCIDEHKANLQQLTPSGFSAVSFALNNDDENVVNIVLESRAECASGMTALHYACSYLKPKYVRKLIAEGIDVNVTDNDGHTPLMLAVRNLVPGYDDEDCRRQVIRLMLESGADPNQMDNIEPRHSVLDYVITEESTEAGKSIIEYVAKVEAKTNKRVFDEYSMEAIEEIPEMKSYYQKCQLELATLRASKIEGSKITYFSILTESLDVVTRYARNEDLVKKFKDSDYKISFPVYASSMGEKIDAAVARRRKIELAATVLSEVLSTKLQFFDPTNLIIDGILKYFSYEEINILVDSQ